MEKKKSLFSLNIKNILTGIFFLCLSFFLLLTKAGKSIFIPIGDCPEFLHFYYYLISYVLIAIGVFFILRGMSFIKR